MCSIRFSRSLREGGDERMGSRSLYSPELIAVIDQLPTCVVWSLSSRMGAETDQLMRRKPRRSRPSPIIDVIPISHACAETMNFSPTWSGRFCEHATRQTKTVCCSLFGLHVPTGCDPHAGSIAGIICWTKHVAGLLTDHLDRGLGDGARNLQRCPPIVE